MGYQSSFRGRGFLSTKQAFDRAMVAVYKQAKQEAGYNATRFLQMISEHGVSRRRANSSSPPARRTASRHCGRRAVSGAVLRGERDIARRRLVDYGFDSSRAQTKTR